MIQLDQLITLTAEGDAGVPSGEIRGGHDAAEPVDFPQTLAAIPLATTSPRTPPAGGIDLPGRGSSLPPTGDAPVTGSVSATVQAGSVAPEFPSPLPQALPAISRVTTSSAQPPEPVQRMPPLPVRNTSRPDLPPAGAQPPAVVREPQPPAVVREPTPVVPAPPHAAMRETPPQLVSTIPLSSAEHDASVFTAGHARPASENAGDGDNRYRNTPAAADIQKRLESAFIPEARQPEPAAHREQPLIHDGRRPGQEGQSVVGHRAQMSLLADLGRVDRMQPVAAGERPRPVQGTEMPSVPHLPGDRRPANLIGKLPADRPHAPFGEAGRADFAAAERQVVRTETALPPMSPDNVKTESVLDRVSPSPAISGVSVPPTPVRNEGLANGRISGLPVLDIPMQVTDSEWRDTLGSRVAMLAGRHIGSAELRMNPAELGPVQVQVSVEDNVAKIAFSATHSLTREQLELALPRLREMLEEQGMKLGEASVSDRRGGEQAGTRGEDAADSREPQQHGAAVDVAAAAAVPVRLVPGTGRVDTYA